MELVEVQFKAQRKEFFRNERALYLRVGNHCVVQADRGEDMGLIISITSAGSTDVEVVSKEVLRHATDRDVEKLEEIRETEKDALRVCQEKVAEHRLPMKLVDVEYQFDGNKITFYFTSNGRIDFRELVKDLAGVFRTRIDLRQIGVRDEARRFDGMGMCGRRLCCSTFLKDFEPVTLKMAKDQNLPLTPTKISGACGRLMCCLAYELGDYKDLRKGIPKIGSKIRIFGGEHRIEKFSIFRQSVILSDPDGNTVEVRLDDFRGEIARPETAAAEKPAPERKEPAAPAAAPPGGGAPAAGGTAPPREGQETTDRPRSGRRRPRRRGGQRGRQKKREGQ
ncbi:MAG: stage 0 sporulation family protein [Candidatus Krumholzibacteriota bacterium]|nr:stage 0 sporulation family protein [Candidatus Krumholzibacteriota bacterium]